MGASPVIETDAGVLGETVLVSRISSWLAGPASPLKVPDRTASPKALASEFNVFAASTALTASCSDFTAEAADLAASEAADSADDSAAAADLPEFVALRAARSASAFADDALDPALVSEDLASAAEAAVWSLIAPTSATAPSMTPASWTEDS